MKKTYKVISAIAITLMIICMFTNVFATSVSIDNVKTKGSIEATSIDSMEKFGGTILKYITNAAMIAAVIMIAVIGIKYMMGSAEEKAEYKKSLLPLLVGAILVFAAATVAKIIVGLANSF